MKLFFDKFWHKTLGRPYRLNVQISGKGRPVVLLHGLAQSWQKWQPLLDQLDERKWQVIAPDLLGFGASPKPVWNKYGVQEHARMVVVALKKTNVKKRVTLVGHSMGCLVAVQIAKTYPQLVKRLVLYEPPLFVNDPAHRKHARRRSRYFALYEYIASHPQLAFLHQRFMWRTLRRLTGLHLSQEEWTPFARSLRNTVMRQTAYDDLRDTTIPTDIVFGRLDMIVTRTEAKRMFVSNPHVHLHLVNAAHDITTRASKYLVRLLERQISRPT